MKLNCSVVRNENETITRVNDQHGNESRVFTEIAAHPLVTSPEQALEIYENLFTEKVNPLREKLSHQIKNSEDNTTLDDMTKGGELIPEDFYTKPSLYADLSAITYNESWDVIKTTKGQPEAQVTIYRSVPVGIDTIESGDWVSLSPTYAKEHGMHPDDESLDMPVISMQVKASEVVWDGNDMNEFAYFPENEKEADTSFEAGVSFGHEDGSDYRQALKNVNEGEEIKLGFRTPNGFYPVLTTTKNTDKSSETGFVQAGIIEGTIAPMRVKVGNEYLLQSEGNSQIKKAVTMQMVEEGVKANLGSRALTKSANTFSLKKTLGKVTLTDLEGNPIEMDEAEIDAMTLPQLKSRFQFAEEIIFQREWQKNRPARRENKLAEEKPAALRSEEDLHNRLLGLLNKLGVSVTSISNYVSSYTMRNGVNPGASALADIANQVVAFAEGRITLEDLTEETSHFINEAMPQAAVENVLRNIDKSEEYKEFAEVYRSIYSGEYEGQELEDIVRREVLGKVVARSIAARFSTENKTEMQANFIDKALEMVQEFFKNIQNFFKADYRKELDGYLQDVQNLLDAEDIAGMVDTTGFGANKFRFYNVQGQNTTPNDKIRTTLKKSIDYLQRQEADLRRTGGNSRVNRLELDRVEKDLDGALKQHSVRSIVSMVENSERYIKAAIEDSVAKNKKYLLSAEENLVFVNLIKYLRPAMSELKVLIDQNYTDREWKDISATIDKVSSDLNTLEGLKGVSTTQTTERLIDSVTTERGLSEASRESLRKWMVRADSDVNYMQSTFGTLVNSQDAMLSLLGLTIGKINGKAHRDFQSNLKELQTVMDKNGVSAQQVSEFFWDKSKKYILSEWNLDDYEANLNANFVQAYKQVTGSTEKDEDILKKWNKNDLKWTAEQQEDVFRIKKELDTPEQEKRMAAAYYEAYEKRLKDNNISEDTKRELSAHIADVQQIKSKAIDKNGRLDITLLNAQDRLALQKTEQRRSQLKSYIGADGELKEGLRFALDADGSIRMEEGKPVIEASVDEDKLPVSAKVALELNRLDASFERTNEKDQLEFPQAFLDGIRSLESMGRSEQLAYLELNAFTGFTSEFWDSMSGGKGLVDKLRNLLEEDPENYEIRQTIDDIVDYNFKIRGIIRNHTMKNNPSETDVESMSALSIDNVKVYQEQLETLYGTAREFLKDVEDDSDEDIVRGVSGVNESYLKRIQDLGYEITPQSTSWEKVDQLKAQLEEARQHMTAANKKQVTNAESAVESFLEGRRKNLPKSLMKILDAKGLSADDLHNTDTLVSVMKEYAESRLLPYYKRYTPDSYNNFRRDLQDPTKNVADILENLDQYEFVDVRPNYSFYEADQSEMNPEYVKNAGTGFSQPNMKKYKNKEFERMFGKVTRDSDTGEYLTAQKNQKQFEVYKKLISFRKSQLDSMNMGNSYNIYQAPQLRKQTVEKFATFVKGASAQKLKDAWEDFASYTEDDMVKGDNRLGTQGNTIPKKFVQRLENQTDISSDLFTGLAMTAQEAYLYAARHEYFADVMALQDKVLTREYDGKTASATRAYKMMDSAIQYSIFGVKEEVTIPFKTAFGEVDMAKLVNQFGSIIRFKGLGGSVIIPFTASLTQKAQQVIERAVGQYIDNRTYKLGDAKLKGAFLKDAMKEFGQVDTKAPLNVLGQYFQSFDLDATINNSKYGFLARNAPRVGMGLYAAMNYPLYASNLMSTLHDFRIVNGKVYKSSDFYREQTLQGRDQKDIKNDWIKAESSVIFNFIDIKDRQVNFNREKLSKLLLSKQGNALEGKDLDSEVERMTSDIRIQIKNLNVRTDSALAVEDRTLAQRTFLLNLAMAFRGFIIPLTENRFKAYSYNPQTRMAESGSYSETYRYFGSVIKEYRKNGGKILQAFKDEYNGNYGPKREELQKLDELEKTRPLTAEEEANKKELKLAVEETYERAQVRRQGLKRIGIDMVVMNSLMLISLLARAYGDEPDDPYALQMANLLAYRLTSEVYQSNFGIVQNYTDIVANPIQSIDTAKSIGDFMDLFSDEEEKQQKTMNKLLPFASGIDQLADPQHAYSNKHYYAEVKGSSFNLVPAYLMFAEKE